jgi:hypothetical protein
MSEGPQLRFTDSLAGGEGGELGQAVLGDAAALKKGVEDERT